MSVAKGKPFRLASMTYGKADDFHSFTHYLQHFTELLGLVWCNASKNGKPLAQRDCKRAFASMGFPLFENLCSQLIAFLSDKNNQQSIENAEPKLIEVATLIQPKAQIIEHALEQLMALSPKRNSEADSNAATARLLQTIFFG